MIKNTRNTIIVLLISLVMFLFTIGTVANAIPRGRVANYNSYIALLTTDYIQTDLQNIALYCEFEKDRSIRENFITDYLNIRLIKYPVDRIKITAMMDFLDINHKLCDITEYMKNLSCEIINNINPLYLTTIDDTTAFAGIKETYINKPFTPYLIYKSLMMEQKRDTMLASMYPLACSNRYGNTNSEYTEIAGDFMFTEDSKYISGYHCYVDYSRTTDRAERAILNITGTKAYINSLTYGLAANLSKFKDYGDRQYTDIANGETHMILKVNDKMSLEVAKGYDDNIGQYRLVIEFIYTPENSNMG